MLNVRGRYCQFRGRQDVINEQLQAALTLVFIHIEPVDEPHGAFRGRELTRLLDVIEGNRIE
jgi:hypothetical protein